MKLSLIALALFGLLSSVVLPLNSALTTTFALLIVVALQRAANRHLSEKPHLLRRIRQRLLLGMVVGVLMELLLKFAVNMVAILLLWKFVLQRELVKDVKYSEYSAHIESDLEEFLQHHPLTELGWGTFIFIANETPYICAGLVTPWVLTWDCSSFTMVHSHVEDITRYTIVKDIVAFSAAAASGMRIIYVFFWWLVDLAKHRLNEKVPLHSTVQQTALDLMVLVQTCAVIIVCQMAFCIAAAEHHVLDRKRRMWVALGICVIITVPFYFSDMVVALVPMLTLIPDILRKFTGTLLALAALEHTRRRYCCLLCAARQKDAELLTLPAMYSRKLS